MSSTAALSGTYGLQAEIDNTSLYLTDWRPFEESRYRARFYFDPNSITGEHDLRPAGTAICQRRLPGARAGA